MKIEGKLSTEKIQAYLLRFQYTHMHEQTKKKTERQTGKCAGIQTNRQTQIRRLYAICLIHVILIYIRGVYASNSMHPPAIFLFFS